jgi:hypothetical protein
MRAAVDSYFREESGGEDFQRLDRELNDWGLWGGLDSFEDFQIWEMSGFVVCPFPGGFRQQPWWVRDDFKKLLKVKRWHSVNAKLPTTDGLPRLEDN